jgi:hypothetical protein
MSSDRKHIVKAYRIMNPEIGKPHHVEEEFRVEDVEGCDEFVNDIQNVQKIGTDGPISIQFSSHEDLNSVMDKCPFCGAKIELIEIGSLKWVLVNDRTGKEFR